MPPFPLPPAPVMNQSPELGANAAPSSVEPSDEQKQALIQRIQDFNSQVNQLSTQQTMSQREMESNRAQTIVKALQVLMDVGVNPSDPQSITRYLLKLAAQEPDMAEMVKGALNGIFGGGPQPQPDQMQPPQPIAPPEEPMF